jgi:hypothetical protein
MEVPAEKIVDDAESCARHKNLIPLRLCCKAAYQNISRYQAVPSFNCIKLFFSACPVKYML